MPVFPAPQADWKMQAPPSRQITANNASLRCCPFPDRAVPSNIAGMNRLNASQPRDGRWLGEASAVDDPAVATVSFALPVPLLADMLPIEHVGDGLTMGVILHERLAPVGLKPFEEVTVTVATADSPGARADGDSADTETLKSDSMVSVFDVLELKLPFPP